MASGPRSESVPAPWVGARSGTLARSRAAALAAAWFLAVLGLYLLGNGQTSLWDRDEPRFAGAAREMLATGHWIVPRFNESNRYDKPILIYWLMGAAMRGLGANEFAARLASSLAGAGVVALVFLLALRLDCSAASASMAAAVVMLSPQVFWLSKAATADALLLMTIVGAMALYGEQRRSGFSWPRYLGICALLGASVLTKGPPGPAIVGAAVLLDWIWDTLARRRPAGSTAAGAKSGEFSALPEAQPGSAARGVAPILHAGPSVRLTASAAWPSWAAWLLRAGIGGLVFLGVVLPWAVAAWRQTRGEFFRVGIGYHVVTRTLSPLDAHRGPLWDYLPVLLIATFPETALVLMALRWAAGRWDRREVRLLWFWFVPGLVMFSLAQTKLPHYIAPVIPALALISGLWWTATAAGAAEVDATQVRRWWRATAIIGALFGLLLGAALAVVSKTLRLPVLEVPMALIGGALALSAVLGGVFWWQRRAPQAVITLTTGSLVAMVVLLVWALPALEPLRPSPNLARWLRHNAPPGTRLISNFPEPSLVFYWGRPVEELEVQDVQRALRLLEDPSVPTALVADAAEWREWQAAALSPPPARVHVCDSGRFFTVERGRWARLLIGGNWFK